MGGYQESEMPVIVPGTAAISMTFRASGISTRSPGSSASRSDTASSEEMGEAAAAQMRELPFYINWTVAHRAIELAAEIASRTGRSQPGVLRLRRLRGGRGGDESSLARPAAHGNRKTTISRRIA